MKNRTIDSFGVGDSIPVFESFILLQIIPLSSFLRIVVSSCFYALVIHDITMSLWCLFDGAKSRREKMKSVCTLGVLCTLLYGKVALFVFWYTKIRGGD